MNAPHERRTRQRIVTVQAGRLRGFWLVWGGRQLELQDLSLEGFAVSASTPPGSDQPFEFVIEHEAIRRSCVAGRRWSIIWRGRAPGLPDAASSNFSARARLPFRDGWRTRDRLLRVAAARGRCGAHRGRAVDHLIRLSAALKKEPPARLPDGCRWAGRLHPAFSL